MKTKKWLLWFALFMAAFSLGNVLWEIVPHRWLRVFTSTSFFVFAIKILGPKKPWGLLIFISLVLCDIFLLKWESSFAKYAYYGLHGFIMLSLILLTVKGMEWKRISSFEIISVLVFLLFCSIIFFSLKEFFNIENVLLKILFNINGLFVVLLVVLSFFNSINDSKLLASSFFLGILGLIFSELIMFMIYFLEVKQFRYIDNFFYVFGLFFILKVSLENRLMQQIIADKREKEKKEKIPHPERKIYR